MYTRAQIGVSAVPGLAQIFRVKITPGSPESWIRAGVVSVIDFVGLGAAAGMTVAAACSPGPSILTPPTLPSAPRNSRYEVKLSASGGDQNFNWGLRWKAVNRLPAWLTLVERLDPKREGWKDTYLVGTAPNEQVGYDFNLVVSDNYAPPQTSDAVTFHLQVT
jgi:hypothetical protein